MLEECFLPLNAMKSRFAVPQSATSFNPFQLNTMKMKKYKIIFVCLNIGLILFFNRTLAARAHYSFYLNGPSISKHFDPYHRQFKDFHPGIGGEFYFYSGRLL